VLDRFLVQARRALGDVLLQRGEHAAAREHFVFALGMPSGHWV
jgi:hypothetical protein